MCVLSCVQLFATPCTVAHHAPLSMELLRQEYRNGLPFPSPGDLPNPGVKPTPLASPALATVPPEMQCLTLRKRQFSSLLFIGLVEKFIRVFP